MGRPFAVRVRRRELQRERPEGRDPVVLAVSAVSVPAIVEELRHFVVHLWERTSTCPLVVGHSAGGQLTAALVASRWHVAATVPADLVRAGISISGVFDLRPLVHTSINDGLRLDEESARAVSPSSGRHRQTERLSRLWARERVPNSGDSLARSRSLGLRRVQREYVEVEAADHFTVVDRLAETGAQLHERAVELTRWLHSREVGRR
jgi:arylformamidase